MLIKSAQDRKEDIEALEALMRHPQATSQAKANIEWEIRMIRAGAKAEKDAAYEIDFHHKSSKNWAVIHDLRIEHADRVAQIDHLLINRFMEIWVCESKSFSQGVAMNEMGEFTAFFGGNARGIASPIEQNRRHILVLQSLLKDAVITVPKRLGFTLMPRFESAVLISQGARITRPRTPFAGLETVMKNDQLRSTIDRRVDKESGWASTLSVCRVVAPETLELFAQSIAKLHRPIAFDWAAKFGLPKVPFPKSAASVPPSNHAALPAVSSPAPAPAVREPVAAYRVPLEPVSASIPEAAAPVYLQAVAEAKKVFVQPFAQAEKTEKSEKDETLPTFRLARKWGVRTADAIARLHRAGYLEALESGDFRLTSKATGIGAVHVERGPHAPYFRWPSDLEA
ncbi:NERD domain-containing protein [Acidovorax sp. SUPP2522]|uniref:nuclease-related domain-containing protein n=1 Tax=unclassified Acidovorax TaxID=2684926 RepID=UPI00234967C8|nr:MULTISPECIES: NERD domain-containing protein [unclassified Acidovorax]WCM95971.1 NERD domain-containing protein [Acidovorax sp. GBBC 1281]GKT17986.1 NERD domain-containing protein [Acidovorax sp. SUPP2522]